MHSNKNKSINPLNRTTDRPEYTSCCIDPFTSSSTTVHHPYELGCAKVYKPMCCAMRFALTLALLALVGHARVLIVPMGSFRRGEGRPVSLFDALDNMISGFGVHSTPHFARNSDGDLVVTVPLSENSQKGGTKEQTLSAVLKNDGRSLLVRAAVHSASGSQQIHTMARLRIRAIKVKSSNFDKSGNARVVLKPADGADVNAFHLESKADAAQALAGNEDEDEVVDEKKADGGNSGPSTLALWQAALFGAFATLAGLAFIQYRRHRRKGTESGPGVRESSPQLTQVLSQRVANGEDVVLFEARKKADPPRKKSDEKVS